MSKPACVDCRFWQAFPIGDPPDSGRYTVTDEGTGACRRYPPSGSRPGGAAILDTADAAMAAAWPITWNFDWCGEYELSAPARR